MCCDVAKHYVRLKELELSMVELSGFFTILREELACLARMGALNCEQRVKGWFGVPDGYSPLNRRTFAVVPHSQDQVQSTPHS